MKSFLIVFFVCAAVALAMLVVLISWPVSRKPAGMASITSPFASLDFSDLPAVKTLESRDGSPIAYRHYRANGEDAAALLLHGSSANSRSMHPLARALARGGVSVYAIDIRGHGDTGRRGDADSVAQPAQDVSDMLAFMRNGHPDMPLTLLGFSSGGGLALNAAGQGYAPDIDQLLLVSPMLGVNAASSSAENPNASSGQWAFPDVPRIIGLTILDRLGIHVLDHLPVIAFAAGDSPDLTPRYSHRLLLAMNPQNPDTLLKNVAAPITLLAGDKDEVFTSGAYAETIHATRPEADVRLLAGLGHVDMTLSPKAFSAVGDAIPRKP